MTIGIKLRPNQTPRTEPSTFILQHLFLEDHSLTTDSTLFPTCCPARVDRASIRIYVTHPFGGGCELPVQYNWKSPLEADHSTPQSGVSKTCNCFRLHSLGIAEGFRVGGHQSANCISQQTNESKPGSQTFGMGVWNRFREHPFWLGNAMQKILQWGFVNAVPDSHRKRLRTWLSLVWFIRMTPELAVFKSLYNKRQSMRKMDFATLPKSFARNVFLAF